MSPEQLRSILRPWALKLMGDATEAAVSTATKAHPMLGSIATQFLASLVTPKHLDQALDVLDQMLREVVGDDYPAIIEAKEVRILDKRSGP